MKFREFQKRVQESYKGKFAHSLCDCYIFKGLGKSIVIDCYLAAGKHEFINGICQNDMFRISFWISLPDGWNEQEDLPENLVMEPKGKSYAIKSENKNIHCDYRKISCRKVKGNSEKFIESLDKVFQKLHDSVVEDWKAGNIHRNFTVMVKEKI